MIKLVTAFLTLGVSTAIAMTAIAQRGWWVGCDPEVDWCRLISGEQTHDRHQEQTLSNQGEKVRFHSLGTNMPHGSKGRLVRN